MPWKAVEAQDEHDRENGAWHVVTDEGDWLAGFDTQAEAEEAAQAMNAEEED